MSAKGVNWGKLKNVLYWIVMSVLIAVILYNLYNRYAGKTPIKMAPGQTKKIENSEGTDNTKGTDTTSGTEETEKADKTNGKEQVEEGQKDGTDQDSKQQEEKIMAPDFELVDLEGKKVKLTDYRGKVVFLNFWALWCPFCVQEMPDLNSANKKFLEGEDAVIITVNSGDSADKVKEFMKEKKLSLPVLLDTDGSISNAYGVSGIPITFIIDSEGAFYAYISGATNEKTLMEVVEEMK
ncbi:MAG TPA: TlpA disulfide reductase family protein [Clostridiales bacterium]|nr:TlpA disulfide reductase family protein [Clostridiales bacterium]